MRFLLLSTDYLEFLKWLYAQDPRLRTTSYEEQSRARALSLFGQADFCSSNLRRLGHEAWDVDVNNEFMQRAWAREHGLRVRDERLAFRLRRGLVPWISRVRNAWFLDILAAQIRSYKPDVIINYSTDLDADTIRSFYPNVRLLVGTIASPLPRGFNIRAYDLMLSCVDNFVEQFRREGKRSERLRFAFEPAVLGRIAASERTVPVSFVGNLFPGHSSRRDWLERVCEHVPLQMWGASNNGLGENSPLARCHRGPAWGSRMFEILRQSRITLNHHVDVAGEYAGNIRLFEATGVGALLMTDWKRNLHEMFVPGKEIVAYRDANECVEMTRYYLDHEDERAAIAQAGQERTLREHTFFNRMQELLEILRKYV